MNPKELLRSVFLSVMSNKFRVFLTSLGIIIGTFTIIMVVGIGKASSDAVTEQYKRLSVESITISRAQTASMSVRIGGNGSITTSKSMTKEMALRMPDELEYVKSVGICTSTSSPIAYNTESDTVNVQGINIDYADITNLKVQYGDFFTDEDGSARNRVAVLGYNIAGMLFGDDIDDAIGEKVFIKGITFEVVGILERIGGTGGVSSSGRSSSTSPDDMAYIPYDVALRYTSGNSGTRGGGSAMAMSLMSGTTTTFVALANDIHSIQSAIKEIQDYLFDEIGDYTSYTVTDAGSTLSAALDSSNTMSSLLIAVAAIVLIVSGIGIMNVLMVAVKERTREIGILKSIGASRLNILLEFLFEAIFISVLGGLIGVGISYYVPEVLNANRLNIAYSPSLNGLLLGFGFSVITGIFFGYYPAWKASKLKPIDALNTE